MRIRQLQLLRYGKFTDQALSFPAAHQDFHLIVGANEAGKSTTRSAILDLLYGIETRSNFDFLHAKAEMRLGATLEHDGGSLAFVRTKARAKSLFDAAGNALTEASLAPYLGSTDRAFFDHMFGLDHARLEAGGNAILSASDDVGQILFQSAAGIASLGAVRDRLAAEADTLWARRRSGDRAYYIASDALARAEAALKATTVRTKDWLEARARVQELEDRRAQLRGRHGALESDRMRLERVRRVAPALREWRESELERQQLSLVVLLPPDAARQLTQTELELASAERDQQLFADQAQQARAGMARVHPDVAVLQRADDIQAIAERRQQVRHHGRDIERREAEVEVHRQRLAVLARQLGWAEADEAALMERLPTLPDRATVAGLARRFGALDQARRGAASAEAEKAAELGSLQAQLEGLSVTTVAPALRVALNAARALGDLKAGVARDAAAVARHHRELAAAMAGLGGLAADSSGPPGSSGATALRELVLPSESAMQQRLARSTEARTRQQALADRLAEQHAATAAHELDIAQYRNAHQPVSVAELAEARAARDTAWQAIRSGERPVPELAPGFEARMQHADSVADQRHDKAREIAELQSRLDALERLRQQAADTAARLAAQDLQCDALDRQWAQLSAGLGLAGMPPHEFDPWRAARDRALRADEAVSDARQALDTTQAAAQAASSALTTALTAAGVGFDPDAALETLTLLASDFVEAAAATKARRDQLERQREAAAQAAARQRDNAAGAQAGIDAWLTAWRDAASRVGLAANVDPATAEGALAVMAEVDAQLDQIREIRQARIDTMRQDLRDFEREVFVVATAAAPDLAACAAVDVVGELVTRLARAQDDRKEADRLKHALDAHEAQAAQAAARVERARAALRPLLHLAQAGDHDALRALIAASDRRRLVEAAVDTARRAVEEGGDGLAPAVLQAEVDATDATQAPLLMADLERDLQALRHDQEGVTAALAHASAELALIAGHDAAARAESDRQDALAGMANAAERYVKVHTATRLLKWAIDRYRETRQGPLLARAGEIFAALTLGSFRKLTVDFESEPLTLHGLRAQGELVGVAGMSDGTRDQLYLALRLAALELHLGQGHALPFIADDLFINYDDRRARAGLEALARLSEQTQVIFLSHHDHLVPTVRAVFGAEVNVIGL